VGSGRIGDQRADLLQQARPVEELPGERDPRGVEGRGLEQPGLGVGGDDAGEQVEVVVDDRRVDALAGDVDQPGSGLAKQQQEE
jgi:hypothetical protein